MNGTQAAEPTEPAGATAHVGIVLVSHSAAVAESVARLAAALAGASGAPVPITGAGGTPDGGFGTDADAVARAAHQVDQGRGVVILADLGSAVLTVRTLLAEGDELPAGSAMADAPFVEGAVAALFTAGTGADRTAVAEAAREAYDYRKE
ncbi:PTS fructose transporter subunit IIA [Streptomyces sp. N2-109]|uniref:PTS fructose transporter subunit IIA n=1 Tax=Streptomyces gossypii TaxID=2883101 RepID=A0ABT2K315_9ACTN|nr:PTS fructose transporter subunit IIA [Streptomyces gossypii]MCT2594570.1 PTS fructose transporter subunit IIA [Streptomyces gossypii]